MIEKVLTDNFTEKITAKWDGVRFILVKIDKLDELKSGATLLNPVETIHLMKFLQEIPELRSGVVRGKSNSLLRGL